MSNTLYLLDGHYLIYRAFYGLPDRLTSRTGEPTGAVHVFSLMLANLLKKQQPGHLAMVMDVSDETVFRRALDGNYKAHRDAAPEALLSQAERIVSIVQALGIPLYRLEGYEADDLMATFVHQLRDRDIDIFLVSRDKDLEQLLSDRVRLFDPVKEQIIGPTELLQNKGYPPERAVEIQTLVGDSTDNIPGVPGIGPKTAVKLIGQYGTAQAVVDHADELSAKMAEKLRAFRDQLPITRQLVTLRRDVPVQLDLEACAIPRFNLPAARPIFEELGFSTVPETFDALAREAGTPVEALPAAAEPKRSELGQYHLIDTPEQLEVFARALSAQSIFALDTETTGLNAMQADLVGLSFAFRSGEGYYIPVRSMMGRTLSWEAVSKALRSMLESDSVRKVGHHLKFDVQVLRQAGVAVGGLYFDTMIAAFVLEPLRGGFGLDALVKGILGHDMIPITELIGRGRDQITLDAVDTQTVCTYAAEDADFTWRLYEVMGPQMEQSTAARLFNDLEMPLVSVLIDMEHHGIALDTKLLARLGRTIGERLEALGKDIHRAAGRAFNVDSPKQLAEVLFDELGFTPLRKTKTGRSTDAESLASLEGQVDNPLPGLVLQWRELAKLKSTYVDTLPRMVNARTGRVHAGFHQTGAVTGRLSSSDPNLQNIPIRTELGRQIREAFVAGDDTHLLLTADYSQIELRLLAHFCQDEALLEAFRRGLDIHRAVAAEVHGVGLEAVTPAQRRAAKAVNFGIIYGQTAFGLSRGLGIPMGEARTFIDTYFQRYPGIRRFIDHCIAEARRTGYAETILGRRRPIPELHSRNRGQVSFGERIAVNTVVQGSAADLIKRAMVDIYRALGEGSLKARMIIQVHDELVFEVPKDELEATADLVRTRMTSALPLNVPIVVDLAWGRNWAESK